MSKVYNIGGYGHFVEAESDYLVENFDVSKLTAVELKQATYSETSFGHTYNTIVNVALDSNDKISMLYVTGTEYSDNSVWGDSSKWTDAKDSFIKGLIGKSLEDIQTMLGSDEKAEGADVVTGATLSSNRVLNAIVKALTTQAA